MRLRGVSTPVARERFPTLTAENIQEALDYQAERVAHWERELVDPYQPGDLS